MTWLDGRGLPRIHVQGDTLAQLHRPLGDVASRLRPAVGDSEALDDLDYTVEKMTNMCASTKRHSRSGPSDGPYPPA